MVLCSEPEICRSWNNIFEVALWTEPGQITFESGGADVGRISENFTGGVVVPTVPLAEFLDQRIEFLKRDVEGAETAIIESSREQLPRVRDLFVENHSFAGRPQPLATLLEVLNKSGLHIVAQTGSAPSQPFVVPSKSKGIEIALNIFARRKPETLDSRRGHSS